MIEWFKRFNKEHPFRVLFIILVLFSWIILEIHRANEPPPGPGTKAFACAMQYMETNYRGFPSAFDASGYVEPYQTADGIWVVKDNVKIDGQKVFFTANVCGPGDSMYVCGIHLSQYSWQ